MSTTLTKHSGDSPLDRSEEITVRGKRLHIPVGGSDSSEERAEVEEDESYTVYGAAPYLSRELSPNVVGEPKPEQVSVEEGSILPFDELDSRRAVKQLAASLASSPKVFGNPKLGYLRLLQLYESIRKIRVSAAIEGESDRRSAEYICEMGISGRFRKSTAFALFDEDEVEREH